MTGIMVPPAQAEALFDAHPDFDAQDALRDDHLAEPRCFGRAAGQTWRDDNLAWRDDDADEAPLSSPPNRLPCLVPSFGPAR